MFYGLIIDIRFEVLVISSIDVLMDWLELRLIVFGMIFFRKRIGVFYEF